MPLTPAVRRVGYPRRCWSRRPCTAATQIGDASWSRSATAAPSLIPDALDIWIGDTCTVDGGRIQDYHQPDVAAHLRQSECRIGVNLHAGPAAATAWTGDLSHEYVTINAEYMT